MFCFRCKSIFENKKDKEENKPKAHKLTLSFPTGITQDHSLRSFNETHVGALLWLWIAHSQNLPASHRIKFVRNLNNSCVGLLVPWIACSLFLPQCIRLFFHWRPKWKMREQQLERGSRLGAKRISSFFSYFFSLVFSLTWIFLVFLFVIS